MVRFSTGGGEWRDVSEAHRFIGYAPMLLVLPDRGERGVLFVGGEGSSGERWEGEPVPNGATGMIAVRRHSGFSAGEALYVGIRGEERMLRGWRRVGARVGERLAERDAAIPLDANAQCQIRVAYSVPRVIALATVATGAGVNRFPTDLHGADGAAGYVVSLRVGSRSGEQVRAAGGLLLSHPPFSAAKAVYAMGRNHMREGGERSGREVASPRHGLPFPDGSVGWMELALKETMPPVGIHLLHRFEILGAGGAAPELAHIHRQAAITSAR